MQSAFPRVTGVAVAALLMLALGAAGCRQSDGPVPEPNADRQEELNDVAQDLVNVARRDTKAPTELRDDLVKFTEGTAATAAVGELAQRPAAALTGTRLSSAEAGDLAHHLWLTITATELSNRQAKRIRSDAEAILKNVGAAEAAARAAGEQMLATQAVVTSVRRRWYHIF